MEEILFVAKENYFNLDNLIRNFLNIKYDLDLPLKGTLNEIISGYGKSEDFDFFKEGDFDINWLISLKTMKKHFEKVVEFI